MKNDFLTLIRTRRSIRAYKPDAVPADVLARVLEAGTYAPSAMGEQSATIVAVETKAYRDRLTKLNAAVEKRTGRFKQKTGRCVSIYSGSPRRHDAAALFSGAVSECQPSSVSFSPPATR